MYISNLFLKILRENLLPGWPLEKAPAKPYKQRIEGKPGEGELSLVNASALSFAGLDRFIKQKIYLSKWW